MISSNNYLPLVSFVIPTHNRAAVLPLCLDSVLNQSYPNIEVIVVNDHSTDETGTILEDYALRFENLRCLNNEGIGGNAARNLGIMSASGVYIAFMDDDDICEPFRIEEQMKAVIESNYSYNFIISGFTVYVNGRKHEKINYLKPLGSVGFTVRWMIKKDILIKAGLFDTSQPSLQDVEFFWRLRTIANIHFNNKSVVKVMSSPISITKNKETMIKGMVRLLELHGNKMSPSERNYWIINICKKYALLGKWQFFSQYLKLFDIKNAPFSGLLLYLSSFTKSTGYLKLHSRLTKLYFWSRYLIRKNAEFNINKLKG